MRVFWASVCSIFPSVSLERDVGVNLFVDFLQDNTDTCVHVSDADCQKASACYDENSWQRD